MRDIESAIIEDLAPLLRMTKRAVAGSLPPLHIVSPTDKSVQRVAGYIFINDYACAWLQHAVHFFQYSLYITRVMKHITKQSRIECSGTKWDLHTVESLVIDLRG